MSDSTISEAAKKCYNEAGKMLSTVDPNLRALYESRFAAIIQSVLDADRAAREKGSANAATPIPQEIVTLLGQATPLPYEIKEVMGQKFIAAKPYEGHPYFNRTTTPPLNAPKRFYEPLICGTILNEIRYLDT